MLNLTNNEKTIILFFAIAVLIGSVVHQCKIRSAPFDYTPNAVEKEAIQPKIININSAGERALTHLKGIGPALAERIVNYRIKFGPFGSKKDITKVKGIGPKKYEQIKDVIIIDDKI